LPPPSNKKRGITVVEQDRIFMKNFSLLIAGLAVMTATFVLVGSHMNALAKHGSNPQRVKAVEARIAPISQNYLGSDGEAAVAAISSEVDASNAMAGAGGPLPQDGAAAGEPATAVAAGDIDGGAIFNSVCFACHLAGVAGAPKLETAAWKGRIAQGVEQLVDHATNGFQGSAGVMPAKGGRIDLSDAEIEATVHWMLDHLE